MIIHKRLRRKLAQLILRGPIAQAWIQRKVRKLEKRFCAELVASSQEPLPAPAYRPPKGSPLRSLLFIGDIMWEANDLLPELRNICQVTALDLNPRLRSNAGRLLSSQVVAATVREFQEQQRGLQPDLVFFYGRPSLLSEEVFELLRRRWSCPFIGMNLDDKVEFLDYRLFSAGDHNYQRWARLFDLNITNGLAASDWYRRQGLPCIYAPQGVHRPRDLTMPASTAYKFEFSFLGSRKPERTVVINQIQAAGISIHLFGGGWPNGQWVDDPNAIYRSSQINLGIGFASPSLTLTTTKGRDFECPGVGACYLTTYNWELANQYEIGKEILCYRSLEELIEVFSYYRKRPEQCLQIAQAAWRRCGNEHTWEKRFRAIFRAMGFDV